MTETTTPTRDPAAPLAAASPTPGAGGVTGGDAPALVAFQGLTVTRCAGSGWGYTGTLKGFPVSKPPCGKGGAADGSAPPAPLTESDHRAAHQLRMREIGAMSSGEFAEFTREQAERERDHRDEQEQARRPL